MNDSSVCHVSRIVKRDSTTVLEATAGLEVGGPSRDLTSESLRDLADDFEDLTTHTRQRMESLHQLLIELSGDSIPEWSFREIVPRVETMLVSERMTATELAELQAKTSAGYLLAHLDREKRRQAEISRIRQAILASLVVAVDWHSPSIRSSTHSMAGRHEGRVAAHHDDYKRDRHPDQAKWEQHWLATMVDNPHGLRLRALMTSSGMSAFTTILAHIQDSIGAGPILMGAASYHECRDLLLRSPIGGLVIFVPESDSQAWRSAIRRSPAAVFLDTMCNASGVEVANIHDVVEALNEPGRETFVVLDNSTRSVGFQPWTLVRPASKLKLLVFESLTKYAQLGMDRASGGVIVSTTDVATALDDLREHLGSNIADVVTHQHPWPNRRSLERRLARTRRNAGLIASALDQHMSEHDLPFRVSYPGLRSRVGITGSIDRGGGLIGVESADANGVSLCQNIIDVALEIGACRGVPLVEGTSFGFDTTRIYLPNPTGSNEMSFLRIAAGTEHLAGIRDVSQLLVDAIAEVS